MKKSGFVSYNVTMAKNIGTEKDPMWVREYASGVVRDTAGKIGAIFRQNSNLLACTKILHEHYEPIYC